MGKSNASRSDLIREDDDIGYPHVMSGPYSKIKYGSPLIEIDSCFFEYIIPNENRLYEIFVDEKNNVYSVNLNLNDIYTGKNSYYIIQ